MKPDQAETKPKWPLWIGLLVWLGMIATVGLAFVESWWG
jgi:hypothetical protein